MDVFGLLTALSFALGVMVAALTDQGREMWTNARSRLRIRPRALVRLRPPNAGQAAPLFVGDRSEFVRDVTIPDGTRVQVGTRLKKTWEIRNVGAVEWKDRYLTRLGPHDDERRLRSSRRVRVPATRPGGVCQLSVMIETPREPGSYTAEWKMTDLEGRFLFPNLGPLFVSVDATYGATASPR